LAILRVSQVFDLFQLFLIETSKRKNNANLSVGRIQEVTTQDATEKESLRR
jgi:hypothetical protein